jgi:hypothetical protein
MATKMIIGKFKITGVDKATASIGDLEKSLQEARDAIKEVEVGGKDFEKLAQHIQKTESRVKTLNKQMEGLEPQQKAEAFLKMGEGIAGGFAVAQGAMGLLGIESENLEKIQTKVQSAIAIAMGVRMLAEGALNIAIAKRVATEKLATITTQLYDKVTRIATISTKAFSRALAGIGIGVVVTLVTALVTKMQSLKKEKEANKQRVDDLKSSYDDLNASIQDHNRERDIELAYELELAQANDSHGKTIAFFNRQRETAIVNQQKANEKLKEAIELLSDQEKLTTKEFLNAKRQKRNAEAAIEFNQKLIDTSKHMIQNEKLKRIESQKTARQNAKNQADASRIKAEQNAKDKAEEDRRIRGERMLVKLQRELAIQSLEDDNQIALLKLQHQEEDELASAMQFENFEILKTQITQKYANLRGDIEKRIDEETTQNKLDLERSRLQQIGIALGGLSGMFAEGTKQFKALKIAEAMINMQLAISNANTASFDMFKNATFFGYPAAMVMRTAMIASAIATGISTIRRIQETPVPEDLVPVRVFARGGTIGGYGTGTTDNVPILASPGEVVINSRSAQMYKPLLSSINMAGGGVGFAEGGQIGGYDMPDMSNQIVKAYVVTDEMTESQDMLAKIRKRATL